MQVCHIASVLRSASLTPVLAELIRTRDPTTLDTCDIVVDVGAVYDENLKRFDHHQRGFEEVFGYGFQTKLSSAGLIYKFVITAQPSDEN